MRYDFDPGSKATPFLGLALCLSLIIGCQSQDPAASDPDSTQTLETSESQNQAQVDDLMEGGFYGERETALVTDPNSESGTDSNPDQSLDSPAAAADPLKDSIVAEMGFSQVDETVPSDGSPEQPSLFCLGLEPQPEIESIGQAQACERISNRLASVSNEGCMAAELVPSQCHSVKGFPILMRAYEPVDGRTPQGRILVIGGTHGDELTSVSIVFKWIEKLNKYHSGLFHWHVIPMMNPDGVLKRGAERTNENGVDLNRNLPSDDWQQNALSYWRNKQGENPRRYPGERAASEPETQWLIDEINTFKPDAIISVHAPYGVVDFDSLVLKSAPRSLGKLHLNLLGTYPGSLGNYAGINRNIPVITLELPHAWVMPTDTETTRIWEDIVSWLKKNVGQEIADANDQGGL